MKKILVLFALMIPVVLVAQEPFWYGKVNRNMNKGNVTTKMDSLAYVGTTKDTSATYPSYSFPLTYVSVHSYDSASVFIRYQLSYDGKAWTPVATTDSLSTTTDGGDVKVKDISSLIAGSFYFRLIFEFNTWKLGTTTPRYTTGIVRMRY